MPLYSYRCNDEGCNSTGDYFQTVDRCEESPACDQCGGPTRQIIRPTYIQPDLPEYQSPVTGKLIRGRRQRKYDLESNNCRPYEGLEAEQKEARKIREHHEKKVEAKIDEHLERAITDLDASNRLTRVGERSDQPYDPGDVRTYN